ncbi:MAG TPA: AraC family transcriptional regulator [Anaerolineales bacterium]|nr:AraC family transcriptional regulator [Anaerolineales bacterium]
MPTKEWTKVAHHPQLDIDLLHAYYVQHAYPRHSHDYYVISLIARGRQSFTHKGTKYRTPAGGLILINPGVVHTGEAADTQGFELRALYPPLPFMEAAAYELTGHRTLPFFKDVLVEHPWATSHVSSLHQALLEGAGMLESQSRLLWVTAQLIKRYADMGSREGHLGREKHAIRQARQYIEDHFAENVSLQALAQHVSLSPYYLLRAFRAGVGMPPYAYLESVRIRHTQRLIKAGLSLAEVAAEVGFSSQSHMTRQFKKIIGVTPGQYAQHVRS